MSPNTSMDGIIMAYMIVKKMADLFQTVFVWSTNEAFTHAHMHMYTHTHTRTHTFRRMQ